MSTLEECHKNIRNTISTCMDEVIKLKKTYSKFFDFDDIFSSENGGKTRLNRQNFNEDHEDIQENIIVLNNLLDTSLLVIKDTMISTLEAQGIYNKINLANFIYDDTNFMELLQMDLETKLLQASSKQKILADINELTKLKNKIYNLKYIITMFDTSTMNKLLNKLGLEDLINSKLIFDLIDTYGLQNEELNKFEIELKNFKIDDEKNKKFRSFNYFLDLHKRKVDGYTYANVRYKISLDYNNEIELKKEIYLKKTYVENIISNFIEQSCVDLVKKELKRGKIQKIIEVNLVKNKKNIQIEVRNNGFEVKNVHSLYLSDNDNKFIIEARNLAKMLNATIDISAIPGEGMLYLLNIKI